MTAEEEELQDRIKAMHDEIRELRAAINMLMGMMMPNDDGGEEAYAAPNHNHGPDLAPFNN